MFFFSAVRLNGQQDDIDLSFRVTWEVASLATLSPLLWTNLRLEEFLATSRAHWKVTPSPSICFEAGAFLPYWHLLSPHHCQQQYITTYTHPHTQIYIYIVCCSVVLSFFRFGFLLIDPIYQFTRKVSQLLFFKEQIWVCWLMWNGCNFMCLKGQWRGNYTLNHWIQL